MPGTPEPGPRRPFGERLVDAVLSIGPLCAGLDPSPDVLSAWGLPDSADGLRAFGAACAEALAGVVPVVKPQVAFFERHGSAGMAALEELTAAARAAGLLVIADAKRGDIGSTAAAYAEAWFRGPLAADAVTAHAYLGFGALAPMVDAARATGGGLFVVVASSNPEGRRLQEAVTEDGRRVEAALAAEIAAANREERGGAFGAVGSVGSVGAVVGATRHVAGLGLAEMGGPVLAPGLGAQGATPGDVASLFGDCPPGTVLPSSSRALLAAGPAGLRDAAARTRDDVAAAIR